MSVKRKTLENIKEEEKGKKKRRQEKKEIKKEERKDGKKKEEKKQKQLVKKWWKCNCGRDTNHTIQHRGKTIPTCPSRNIPWEYTDANDYPVNTEMEETRTIMDKYLFNKYPCRNDASSHLYISNGFVNDECTAKHYKYDIDPSQDGTWALVRIQNKHGSTIQLYEIDNSGTDIVIKCVDSIYTKHSCTFEFSTNDERSFLSWVPNHSECLGKFTAKQDTTWYECRDFLPRINSEEKTEILNSRYSFESIVPEWYRLTRIEEEECRQEDDCFFAKGIVTNEAFADIKEIIDYKCATSPDGLYTFAATVEDDGFNGFGFCMISSKPSSMIPSVIPNMTPNRILNRDRVVLQSCRSTLTDINFSWNSNVPSTFCYYIDEIPTCVIMNISIHLQPLLGPILGLPSIGPIGFIFQYCNWEDECLPLHVA